MSRCVSSTSYTFPGSSNSYLNWAETKVASGAVGIYYSISGSDTYLFWVVDRSSVSTWLASFTGNMYSSCSCVAYTSTCTITCSVPVGGQYSLLVYTGNSLVSTISGRFDYW